jgi:hypothetical protein
MLIIMVPVMMILIQLNLHYGLRPCGLGTEPGQSETAGSGGVGPGTNITLQAPANLQIETRVCGSGI